MGLSFERPMLLRVQHVQITIPAGMEESAREFYCTFLGLAQIPKPASLQGRGGFWMQSDGFPIHVGTEEFDRTQTKAHIAYEVRNLEEWRAKLEDRGLKILESVPIPGFDRFEFRDPFGNRVEFMEREK
jgi:catechol 2,3-dioxygenase-like lactoylglutathione lyase family enzyme